MFDFTLKYLSFLKYIPLLPYVFDHFYKLWNAAFRRELLVRLDEIEDEVSRWEGVALSLHKYGGLQFNCGGKEIGHLHSNGLLDVIVSKSARAELLQSGMAKPHHVLANSLWVSYLIRTEEDRHMAIALLRKAYENRQALAKRHELGTE